MADQLKTLLAQLTPIPGHQPWPRYEVDAAGWDTAGRALGRGVATLMGLWCDGAAVHLALRAPLMATPAVLSLKLADGGFPSLGRHHPAAIRLERAIFDLHGVTPTGAPDRRPWLDHGAWGVAAPLGANLPAALRDPADYDFEPVNGAGLTQIAVGPVHAGTIEPGHFRFTANGETVARLGLRLGYAHKGVDGLLTNCELDRAARIAARVSGDSTVALSFAFARAAEAALGIAVPERAQVLRGVMAELERIAHHIGDIGAICNDVGFALLFAQTGILREQMLAACNRVFGHRLMMDEIVVGGVSQDVSADGVKTLRDLIDALAPALADIVTEYDETPSLQDRTCSTGIVSRDLCEQWGAGGFVGRAAGRDFDSRRDLSYAPYTGTSFEVAVLTAGDVDARVRIRIREVETSLGLLRGWLGALPSGPVQVDVPDGAGEGIAVAEAFRGDLLVWLRIAEGRVVRAQIRDASWFQWPLLEAAIKDNIVADFPVINKSFNCSYSGHDL